MRDAAWAPELLREYGIRPWEVGRFTLRELERLREHKRALDRARELEG